MVRTLVALVLAAAPLACTPGTNDTDDATSDGSTAATTGGATTSATTGASTGATTGAAGPSFTADIWPIFMQSCSCHSAPGAGPPTTFIMGTDAPTAYAAMINMPSSESPLDFIEPGDASKSYVYHKLAATYLMVGGSGDPMPLTGLLDDAQVAMIGAWIDAGALE